MKKKYVYPLGECERPTNSLERRILLKINGMTILRNFRVVKLLFERLYGISACCSFGKHLYLSSALVDVGKRVGLADTFILAYAPVVIGDNCSFSFRNMIITSSHDIDDFSTVTAKPVVIGKNVWITSNVTILGGVTIGDGSIIGAGSVVINDIPPNSFAAGNPCRVIREIKFIKK